MPAKISIFLLIFIVTQNGLSAQNKLNIKFGKVTPEDFNIKSALIDSSTNVVVVADVGKSEFIANTSELTFSLVFTEKKRMKIINKNGFDAATITIPLYVYNNKQEKLEQLNAYTYNLENGKVVETKVAKSSVFAEKHDKNWIYNKFTFPGLKEGSIIEYSYQIKSDFYFNLQPWTFQGEYPVLWSQYEAGIPEFYKYVMLAQGYQPFLVNKVEKSGETFSFVEHVDRGLNADGTPPSGSGLNSFKLDGVIDHHTWIMQDVPTLKEEAFTTTLRNAIAKIEFQLNMVVFPNSAPQSFMSTWGEVAGELMVAEGFGGAIDRPNNWLDNNVGDIVKGAATQKQKAQKIFEYVRDNFTCNENNSIFITTGLKDVLKNKSGSVADINMLLIAMLKSQKIPVNPVILSTRHNGFAHDFYPLMNRYNYVIAKAVIEDAPIYMDASTRHLEFGMLPSSVYNGQGREITKDVAKEVYFIADSVKESGTTNVFIANLDNGNVEGSFVHNFGTYESLNFRKKMSGTTMGDFKKSVQQEYPEEIDVDNMEIDSLKLLDKPAALKFNLKFKAFGNGDIIYFNPMLDEAIKKNPFAAAERFYPVEMPYTIDNLYTLNMEIPKGYKVDELPKSAKFKLNGDEGMFEYLLIADNEMIQMRCRLLLNKANFVNEDYQSLREFYGLLVKKESEQIVFKKIK